MKTLFAVVLLSLPALAADQAPAAAVTTACGADSAKFKVRSSEAKPAPQPEPGKALVYVVEEFGRPQNEIGRPTTRVGVDGSWVGANRGTSYLSFSVDPGEHHLCTDWQSVPPWLRVAPSLASLTAEAGETYYFRARILEHPGFFTLDLDPVNTDEGRMLVDTSPLSDYRPKK
jgi:hypothetical protein